MNKKIVINVEKLIENVTISNEADIKKLENMLMSAIKRIVKGSGLELRIGKLYNHLKVDSSSNK